MISIITAYYNRKFEFYRTLKSIKKSKYLDYELIAVDDGSASEHRIEEFCDEFPFLKIVRIEPNSKWYVNSCIPFNIGIRESVGDIIVLQNPECLHVGDILSHINENIRDDNYLTISAYSLDRLTTQKMLEYVDDDGLLKSFLKSQPQQIVSENSGNGWYNHSKYRAAYLHFCSAITRKNMILLNGFDERYANGIACDDAEIINRIDKLGLNKIIFDDISVIHQWHSPSYSIYSNWGELRNRNGNLYNNVTCLETNFRANNIKSIE
jgi:glycosyltransferase involved in cell wall biosynthesis